MDKKISSDDLGPLALSYLTAARVEILGCADQDMIQHNLDETPRCMEIIPRLFCFWHINTTNSSAEGARHSRRAGLPLEAEPLQAVLWNLGKDYINLC